MYTIVRRAALSQSTFLWEISAADVARACQPGQFVMVRLHDGSERIPLTIADYDRAAGTVTVVVQALGKSTREMADRYHAGDSFDDFVGPLGLPHRVEQVGHAAFVGGGLGVAPVYPLLRAAKQAGNRTTAIVGFRSADLVFWEDRLGEWADELLVCTDDGSYGRAGLVTDALADLLASDRPDLVVAIGPLAMMRACAAVTEPSGVPTTVSLNTIMVDGTGMCGSCRVSVGGRIRFACVDGPEFDAHEVDFAELTARQGRFRHEEDQAVHDYEHLCSLEQQLFADGRYVRRIKDLDPHQMPMPQRDPAARVRTFDEVNLGYSLHEALQEAERCLQCARPTCISGCPVAVDIPRFLRHLAVRDVDGALAVIHESNILPSVCGRVCPQETQCESQCVVGRKLEPVAIGRLERFVGDHGRVAPFTADPSASAERLGRVAIAGSGPAGLACAADLVRAGCHVKVFEGLHVIGGVLQYGIPAFRLPREIIAREVDRLVELGVEFETDKIIGATFTVEQLLGEMGFDAVFLAVGAGAPSFLGLPGELAGQVYSANELLTRVNLMGGDQFPEHDTPVPLGSKVVVIGAGNTAMDCLRVARRLGVPSVRCVYRRSRAEAGARVEELRHAEEEGVEYLWLHSPERILVDDAGDVRGLELRKMALGELDGRGRRSPVPLDELVTIECDTVVYALGTTANPIATRSTPGLALDDRGYVVADDVTQATSLPGMFAGGDIVTGGATVILAMGAGRRAARAITAYLQQGKPWPVTAGHLDAGGADSARPRRGAHCPKCGQTVEGDEAYLCCADAPLQWRCEGCGKVSEGFAFPYGACPACGAALQLLERGPVEGDASLAAIRSAFEIELGGRGFYTRAAAETDDPLLRELFERFSAMEAEHMDTLARRYHVAAPPVGAGVAVDRAAVYAGVDHHPDDPANLFRLAIAFEARAVRFFEERAASATGEEKALFDELAAEEREHVDLLSTEYERWRQDRPGLLIGGPSGAQAPLG